MRQVMSMLCLYIIHVPVFDRILRRWQMEDRGSALPPQKNHNNLGFIGNSGPDPLKTQHSMLGHHQHASETPFKWRFAGGSMMARL